MSFVYGRMHLVDWLVVVPADLQKRMRIVRTPPLPYTFIPQTTLPNSKIPSCGGYVIHIVSKLAIYPPGLFEYPDALHRVLVISCLYLAGGHNLINKDRCHLRNFLFLIISTEDRTNDDSHD